MKSAARPFLAAPRPERGRRTAAKLRKGAAPAGVQGRDSWRAAAGGLVPRGRAGMYFLGGGAIFIVLVLVLVVIASRRMRRR